MITHPSAQEIARAIAQWIEEIRPLLDTRNAYLSRVAVNGLAILARELEQTDTFENNVAKKLSALLGRQGSYESLIGELCAQLRAGRFDIESPNLLSLLREDTLAELAIDQPNYRHEKSDRK